jgi:hypothetical protein
MRRVEEENKIRKMASISITISEKRCFNFCNDMHLAGGCFKTALTTSQHRECLSEHIVSHMDISKT